MPAREIERWWRYWNEEPWGTYRDNLHAALICQTFNQVHFGKDASTKLTDFVFDTGEVREAKEHAKQEGTRLKLEALARRDARARSSTPQRRRGK